MNNRYAVILAAGKGTRMKSKTYKVLHEVGHKAMVERVIDTAKQLNFSKIVTVVGFGAEEVKERLQDKSDFVLQEEQLGTGHAVLQASPLLADLKGTTIVLYGDTPMIKAETIEAMLRKHEEEKAKVTVLTANLSDPYGYGRILRDSKGQLEDVVEEKDATSEQKKIQEINTGIYAFDNEVLFEALTKVTRDNAQGEYYLPDVINIVKEEGGIVTTYQTEDSDEILGVNDRQALAKVNRLFYDRMTAYWMDQGVEFMDPKTVYIDDDVQIGPDTVIENNVQLLGHTIIGEDVFIGANSIIRDSKLGDRVEIFSSVIEESEIGEESNIGPMSHLRPNAKLGKGVHVGNFVEVKNATLGDYTKAGHLAYVGDADLGTHINVSAGVIFANYDGYHKARSAVGDHAFIGSNANVIAPMNISAYSFVAAGSTVYQDIPERAMGIARARQVNKEGYWDKLAVSKNPEHLKEDKDNG